MIDAPSGGAPEKTPRWDLLGTEGYGGGNRVSWCSWMLSGNMSTYRRSRSVEPRGAHKGGGHAYPPGRALHPRGPLVAPPTYFFLLYIPTYPDNIIGGAKNPISTAATFCTREIPSWGLFWCSTGGGIDHGGLLHQQSRSDDV